MDPEQEKFGSQTNSVEEILSIVYLPRKGETNAQWSV